MSHSDSSKTDKEIMWEKLSTVHNPMPRWMQMMGRGIRNGELSVIATGRQHGKSAMAKTMWEMLKETEAERQARLFSNEAMDRFIAVERESGHIKDE